MVSVENESLMASRTKVHSPVRLTSVLNPVSTPHTSALPIATPSISDITSAAKATETPKIASTPTKLITRASETLPPTFRSATPNSEASAVLSVQIPESKTLSQSTALRSQPTLAVIPEKRRTSFLSNPEPTPSSVALSIVINTVAPVITSSPKVTAGADVVTVTVTTTVHDKA